jgi:hypothetical protein
MNDLDLNVATPEEFPQVLRAAAEQFRVAHADLQAAWGDKQAGAIWAKFATLLERTAASADKLIERS